MLKTSAQSLEAIQKALDLERPDLKRPFLFKIHSAKETLTKIDAEKGKLKQFPMLEIEIETFQDGKKKLDRPIKDWIVLCSDSNFGKFKEASFFKAIGLYDEYLDNKLTIGLITRGSKKGLCTLKQRTYMTNDGQERTAYGVDKYCHDEFVDDMPELAESSEPKQEARPFDDTPPWGA